MRQLAFVLVPLGAAALLVGQGGLAGIIAWLAIALALCGLGISHRRLRAVAASALVAVLAGTALLAYTGNSNANTGDFTVHIRTSQQSPDVKSLQVANTTYEAVKLEFEEYAANGDEVTLVFSRETASKLTGLPPVDGKEMTAVYHYDDENFDLTVLFDATIFGQQARVLVSLRWASATDFEPEIAVVFRFERIDLGEISDSWDEFPVRFSNALVAWANGEQTLTESEAMGTKDFFEDGIDDGDNPLSDASLHLIPGGANVQAALHDEPNEPDPLVEAVEFLGPVQTIVVRGSAGKVPGGDDDPDTKALDLTATVHVVTPPALEESAITLDETTWSLQVKGEKQDENIVFFGQLAGKASLNIEGTAYEFGAVLQIAHDKQAGSTTFTLKGNIAELENLFGLDWLDLDKLEIAAVFSRSGTPPTTSVKATITANVTIAEVVLKATLGLKVGNNQTELTGSLALAPEEAVSLDSLLNTLGGQVDERLGGLSLTNFGMHITLKSAQSGTTATVAVTAGADILPNTCDGTAYPAGHADLLVRLELGGAQTKVLVGADVTGLSTKNISCDIPFVWTLPNAMLLFATQDVGPTAWSGVEEPTKTFFERYFCGSAGSTCENLQRVICAEGSSVPCDVSRQSLNVKAGGTIHALMELDGDLEDALREIGIETSGALRVTGTIPIGNSPFSISAAFPTITPGPDAIIGQANLTLNASIEQTSFKASIDGIFSIRIERPDQDTCADVEPSGRFSNGRCYDAVDLFGSLAVGAGTNGLELTLSAGVSGEWTNAFGVPWLTIKNFAVELGISAGPTSGLSLSIGAGGSVVLGEHDLTIAIKLAAQGPPPRVVLEGFTVGTNRGISLQDIVRLFAPDIDESALPPNLSLKRIWIAYGTTDNNTLCIREGLYIRAELHLGGDLDGDDSNPICGTTGLPRLECAGESEGTKEDSCLAGVELDVRPHSFFLKGVIKAFNFGPLAFQDTIVLIDLSLLKQEIRVEGGATLYNPVLWYLNDPHGTNEVWASAYAKLYVKQNAGVFTLELVGCGLLGGTNVADEHCTTTDSTVLQAYLNASITADFTKVGLEFFEHAEVELEVALSSPALQKIIEDIEAGLQPVASFFNDAATAIEGKATEVMNSVDQWFCESFNPSCSTLKVTAEAYTNGAKYVDAEIEAQDERIRKSADVWATCIVTHWFWAEECVDEYRAVARQANEEAIARAGGREYIALHGIRNVRGFGGVVDALDPDNVLVHGTVFNWPGGDEKAPCEEGGVLHGFSICSIPRGEPIVLDDVIGPVLLEALQQLDPDVVALFLPEESQSQFAALQAMATTQTTGVTPSEFIANVKTLGNTFDLNKPLMVCEAKATFTLTPTGLVGDTTFETRIDAYGGKAIVSANPEIGAGSASLNQRDIKQGVISDILDSSVSDLDCPVETAAPGELSFSMSASEINEGDTLVLTGKAEPEATVTVTWGDGSAATIVTADGAGNWTASHTYADGPKVFGIRATAQGAPDATSLIVIKNVAPTLAPVAQPEATNEGSTVTLSGSYSDPGVLDTHQLTVDWGDGSEPTLVFFAAGNSSFSVSHTYVDDDPTWTPEDTYTITLSLRDKDAGLATTSTTVLVKNVVPANISLDTATWAGGTAERDANGALVVPEGTVVTFSGSFRDPGQADLHTVTVAWNEGELIQEATVTRDSSDPTLYRFTVERAFADDHPSTGTPSDLASVMILVSDDDSGASQLEVDVRIANVAPDVTVTPASQEVQYSDPLGRITITANDVRGLVNQADGTRSETLAIATRWKLDDGEWQPGLFGDLALSASACSISGALETARQTCTWSIDGIVNVQPGLYTIEVTITDDDTGTTTRTITVEVKPEDARATYTGPTLISAPSLANGSAEVLLRATVRDISVVPGIEPPDEYPGDITNATVTFVDRATGEALCTAPVVPIFVGNTTTGGASCTATLTLAGNQTVRTYDIGIVVGGWYIRDDAEDDVEVTIERPTGDWVTGGATLVVTGGAGTVAPGGNIDVNASTQWKNKNSEIQGMLRFRFTAGGKKYEVQVTSFDSIGTRDLGKGKSGEAQIEARATLFDITKSPGNPVTVATDLRLQFRLSDTQNKTDSASFALWSEDGLLVAASGWDGVGIPANPLQTGKLQIHFK